MKRFIWAVLIVSFVLFSLSPTFYELSQKEKLQGRSFELIHNYSTDYNFYLTRIRQGIEGRWTVIEKYTTEPHQGSFIQIFYLALGKLHLNAVSPFLSATGIYHISRVVFGSMVLLMTVLWVRMVFPTFLWQLIAFFCVVTASVWPHVVPVGDSVRFGGPMSWWTLMDNLQRITFLPHLLIGQTLVSFLLFAGGNMETIKRKQNWIFLGMLAFVLGMIFPPGLVFVGVAYGMMMVLSLVQHGVQLKKLSVWNQWFLTQVVPRGVIGLLSVPSFLYFFLMFTLYPWKRLVELDIIHPLPFAFPEYIQALGPTLPLGVLGLLLAITLKDRKFMSVVAWVLAWFLCLFIFQYIPQQSPLRFSEMLPHVPLGILTTYVFYSLSKVLQRAAVGNRIIDASPVPSSKFPSASSLRGSGAAQNFVTSLRRNSIALLRVTAISVPLFIIVVGLGVMASSFLWQKDFIDQKVAAGWPPITMKNFIVYPITDFTDALSFIEKETPKNAIILSDMATGNYIPPYTGRSVFVGHNNTVGLEMKLDSVRSFYRGEMKDAQTWLKQQQISYIFFGPEEQELANLEQFKTTYPFLTVVFRNNAVVVFKM